MGHILIFELPCAKASCIAEWEKQERWRDVGESNVRGHIALSRRFGRRPVLGSHKEAICSALGIRQSARS